MHYDINKVLSLLVVQQLNHLTTALSDPGVGSDVKVAEIARFNAETAAYISDMIRNFQDSEVSDLSTDSINTLMAQMQLVNQELEGR